jgi:hypothetical protein
MRVVGGTRTIAILGAGRVGTVLARLALAAGYEVLIAGSGQPEQISVVVAAAAPGAVPATAADAARRADLTILALPLARLGSVPAHELRDRTVVDAMNRWPHGDGERPGLGDDARASSETVRDILGVDRIVKTFNHMGYRELEACALPGRGAGRRALAVAGDDPVAVTQVAVVVDAMGFDPVPAGPLAISARLEPGAEIFGADLDRETMLAALARPILPGNSLSRASNYGASHR